MTGLGAALEDAASTGDSKEGISIKTFLASLATAVIVFAVEFLLFMLLKGKLTRIYQPRTYLVPDRERTKPSPPGLFRWIGPVFRTSNSEFIQKCGLDAYFFLRYLRMLLKIFLPLAVLILPVLLPLNKVGGKGTSYQNETSDSGARWNVTGLDQLAWENVRPENTHRYWGHLALALIVIIYVCAIFFDELRGYIRLRQAYLTSPQHRLRASATTVLVTAIPRSWLTVEALDALYDVFPGGIRSIWLNRNFDELNAKVKLRNKIALALEAAETDLIAKCKKAQLKMAKAEAKKAGKNSIKTEKAEEMEANSRAAQIAMNSGISSGNPHQIAHTLDEALHPNNSRRPSDDSNSSEKRGLHVFNPVGTIGHGVGKLGKSVLGGLRRVEGEFDGTLERTGGLVTADDISGPMQNGLDSHHQYHQPDYNPESMSPDDERHSYDRGMISIPANERRYSDQKRPFWKRATSSNSRLSGKGKSGPLEDEYPLTGRDTPAAEPNATVPSPRGDGLQDKEKARNAQTEDQEYPVAYNEKFDDEDYGDPAWKKYIKPKDRDTMRLPIFGWGWMPSLPLIGKKVDTIDHCRKELARLNLEIEIDQQHPERFPLMNSAFIQFNHQVAAHMACQTVSHHLPKQMAPRIVEISPDDVIWDNMSMKWWERYLRTFGIVTVVCAMVVGWAFPVAFTGLLSQLTYLEGAFSWLSWIGDLPEWFISAVQGVLPALFLAILMAILPLILRFLSKAQGVHTGMAVELTVQSYYFAFLFVQLFLVVSIASSFSTIVDNVTDVTNWPEMLAQNVPKSSNYFFSYMVLQAMSVSAGALVQVFNLISWFILAPILDKTARKKWARTTNLNQMQWGTFFPVYTTLASIGLIYSIIAPLILVFNVLTFGLFWFVYRYNTLYVTKFRFDTGGLLFPKAINQLFTGLYAMEIALIGLFFLVRDVQGNVSCKGQAICMIVVLVLTVGYQLMLNEAFGPLMRYLPITLEDDAVARDQEFARAQRTRLGLATAEDEDIEQQLAAQAQREKEDERRAQDIEMKDIDAQRQHRNYLPGLPLPPKLGKLRPSIGGKRQSWADREANRRSRFFESDSNRSLPTMDRLREHVVQDAEAQGPSPRTVGHALFAGIHDQLEDLTPDERDQLVQRAFQHEAIRAKRPVIWIPRDDLGVSDDEVYRTQRFSKHIWVSNEYQALDGKCRTIFSRSPPDFSEVDLIQL
ncbi:hypothetical protein ASPZODRAFT_126459 [Penicilliopsis zonata CBS 506.65]|uniref:CSC1/OSCA1-like 7TM region domain-containing protein n=1 Tax=Penicilliopsis zonata CBS 506.65 TaxID=1073090 RepID=A0A1L9STN9_9EURO|nr:hypothetical protein ASPZODRAFT_126459 [Penicilliopsis zonata CBS 506.65]OJJ50572.1 hypothetical protein ASPZODRAFT_126459 [Penicilliopsis zonata CBS 506.65]